MLENYVKEFVGITDFIIKNNYQKKKTLQFFIVDKKIVIDLLDKNKYETATNKLKAWKALNWIDTDDRKVTRRIYDKKSGRYLTAIYIYIKVYEQLKKLDVK